MVQETRVQSQVVSYRRLKEWYLMPFCLRLSIIRYISGVKWSNPGKGIVTFTTLRCSSYWEGSSRGALDCCRQYIYIYIIISIKEKYLKPFKLVQIICIRYICQPQTREQFVTRVNFKWSFEFTVFLLLDYLRGYLRGVMVKVRGCGTEVSEFKL